MKTRFSLTRLLCSFDPSFKFRSISGWLSLFLLNTWSLSTPVIQFICFLFRFESTSICLWNAIVRAESEVGGNVFTVASRMNCALSLVVHKINQFYPKIFPLFNFEEEWLLVTDYISTCLPWSFVLTRCCALSWVTKILMRAISNVHAGRIWPAGRRFSTPGLNKLPNLGLLSLTVKRNKMKRLHLMNCDLNHARPSANHK